MRIISDQNAVSPKMALCLYSQPHLRFPQKFLLYVAKEKLWLEPGKRIPDDLENVVPTENAVGMTAKEAEKCISFRDDGIQLHAPFQKMRYRLRESAYGILGLPPLCAIEAWTKQLTGETAKQFVFKKAMGKMRCSIALGLLYCMLTVGMFLLFTLLISSWMTPFLILLMSLFVGSLALLYTRLIRLGLILGVTAGMLGTLMSFGVLAWAIGLLILARYFHFDVTNGLDNFGQILFVSFASAFLQLTSCCRAALQWHDYADRT